MEERIASFEKKYEKNDIKKILDLTIEAIQAIPEFIEQVQHKPIVVKMMEEMLRIHPEIKDYIENNML